MKAKAFWLVFLLLWVGLLFPRSLHSQGASALSFTRHDLTIGGNPLAVASADFNGDGKQDIAVLFGPTGGTTTFVAVFLGNGDGTLSLFPLGGFDTGFPAPWLITADLNRDNKPDLVIANGFGGSISVLLGNGDGTFGTKNVIPLPGRIESVIAADFNGDGKLDLAAPDFEPQPYAVSIMLGNGDGTFGPNTDFPTLDVPFVVIADDFNHDGKLDLALNTDLGTVSVIGSVLLGNGDGTFQLKKDFSTGFTQSADLASGDFNSDGKPDLVVTNNADDSISVLLGNGDGTFNLQAPIPVTVTPFRVLAPDIDADGKLDLVVARRNSAAISILTGNGNGTFGTPIDFSTGAGPQFLVVKDLNGDGLLDLVTANNDDGTVSILLNTTAQALTAACTINGSTVPVTVLVTSYVVYNANPNPANGSTCDWDPGTPLPGAFDTPSGSSCAPSSPIYTAVAGGTFSENVTVTNGSNFVAVSCPTLTVQDFSLSVSPTSATASPGSVVAYTVIVSSINGFNGQINLVQSTTLPAGVSAAWSPTSPSCTVPAGGSCSATYTVTVGASASAGDIGLAFHGTYAPVLTTRSVSATLHVPVTCNPLTADAGPDRLVRSGELVSFDFTHSPCSSDGVLVHWDFGDGQTASSPLVHHRFSEPGIYQVRLTITDSIGRSATDIAQITVEPVRLSISFFQFDDLGFQHSATATAFYVWILDAANGPLYSVRRVEYTASGVSYAQLFILSSAGDLVILPNSCITTASIAQKFVSGTTASWKPAVDVFAGSALAMRAFFLASAVGLHGPPIPKPRFQCPEATFAP